ncbi:hypothetical protein HK104_000391 [Borealophlyctis nickersoniae]|nr:hypothetical protein HK104_000391 [Borealophlyctis nickersoniae]
MLEYLRHRGRDLEYLQFPNAPNSSLPALHEFLPNIRMFSLWPSKGYRTEDLVAFIHHAPKLQRLQLGGGQTYPQAIRDVAIARGVELGAIGGLPKNAESREERWMGL